jgi:hypothetical protein
MNIWFKAIKITYHILLENFIVNGIGECYLFSNICKKFYNIPIETFSHLMINFLILSWAYQINNNNNYY